MYREIREWSFCPGAKNPLRLDVYDSRLEFKQYYITIEEHVVNLGNARTINGVVNVSKKYWKLTLTYDTESGSTECETLYYQINRNGCHTTKQAALADFIERTGVDYDTVEVVDETSYDKVSYSPFEDGDYRKATTAQRWKYGL